MKKKEDNNEKKNVFGNIAGGIGNVVSKGAKEVGKAASTAAGGIGATVKKVADISADIAEKNKIKSKNKKIDIEIIEHKYNIGRYIYDNEIDVDDGVVISTINLIDRLVEEITELEGKKNG